MDGLEVVHGDVKMGILQSSPPKIACPRARIQLQLYMNSTNVYNPQYMMLADWNWNHQSQAKYKRFIMFLLHYYDYSHPPMNNSSSPATKSLTQLRQ